MYIIHLFVHERGNFRDPSRAPFDNKRQHTMYVKTKPQNYADIYNASFNGMETGCPVSWPRENPKPKVCQPVLIPPLLCDRPYLLVHLLRPSRGTFPIATFLTRPLPQNQDNNNLVINSIVGINNISNNNNNANASLTLTSCTKGSLSLGTALRPPSLALILRHRLARYWIFAVWTCFSNTHC